jgi:phage-related minor tail protein
VFSGGEVIPFARGGVVSRPTVFPMARGAGLMGEAGPEAIMPLRRDSSGRLGVIVANENRQGGDAGGQVINFAPVTNIDARGASPGTAAALRQELDKRDRALLKQVQGVVSVGMRRGDIR